MTRAVLNKIGIFGQNLDAIDEDTVFEVAVPNLKEAFDCLRLCGLATDPVKPFVASLAPDFTIVSDQ